ncbi:MAG: PA0069 family radical SAM protein [Paracoccaceae bacterium]|nr:PA0069 family radical SAM protein [Paracoccaceae bacterium]
MPDGTNPETARRLPPTARRGRGAVSNRTARYETETREAIDDGWDAGEIDDGRVATTVTDEASRQIITRNHSPDLGFDRSINPYRGCEHGCVYCFARPTHAFLGLSPGLDFETRLFAKPDAPRLLRGELARPSYRPRSIAIGTNTDPYQPVESNRRIMRQILEVLDEARHPVGIVTKGGLIMRDTDILGRMGRRGIARAAISVTTLDRRLSRSMEPRASAPNRRLQAIRKLAAAGCPVGVMVAPVIPAVNDHEIEAILEASAKAGARFAAYAAIRLPLEVRALFREWLETSRPGSERRVMRGIDELHGGRAVNLAFGERLTGKGTTAELIARRFRTACARLGLQTDPEPLRIDLFRAPEPEDQPPDDLPLFRMAGPGGIPHGRIAAGNG